MKNIHFICKVTVKVTVTGTVTVIVTQGNTRVTIRGVGGEEAPLIEPIVAPCDTDTDNDTFLIITIDTNSDIDIDIDNINTDTSTVNSVHACSYGIKDDNSKFATKQCK